MQRKETESPAAKTKKATANAMADGEYRVRTGDLLRAKQALSQLS